MTDAKQNHDPQREQFERTWKAPTGFQDWFKTVNNQPFGNRFMTASMVFFFLAGIIALIMRTQLAFPDNDLLGPEVYNQLFTMHGATMMYLVVLPFMEGIAIYLLPQMIGSREMAYPRMSAFSFWVFFSGGLIFFSGFVFNAVPNTGWFIYPPVSLEEHSGLGLDFLLVGLGFIEIAGIGAGVEVAITILKFRAPGMTLGRMPLFAWAWLVTAAMIIVAFAALLGGTVLIELDRAAGTRFFDATGGGNSLLWQHIFWFFGHPDVYIMFLPATGMLSMIIPTFARRPIAGYKYVVVAIVVTGFMSFGLWVHHMFATGIPDTSMGFFIAASLTIAIASGIQVFAWIATLWRSRPEYQTPLLFALGFLFIFVLGGLTGVMVAMLPFDLQVHDTYFVVAHFHYVLIGGVVFPIIGALYYWLPLITGTMADEKLGKWSFWLIFIGFNVTFFPMHITGLMGLPRRVYTYQESLGVGGLNLLSTLGSYVLGIGFVLVAWNVFRSSRSGKDARKNPWNGGTLEWSVTADMPNYVYLTQPVVTSRYPLWEKESEAGKEPEYERLVQQCSARPAEWRAVLVTDAVTAKPQAIQRVAGPSYVPAIAGIGMFTTSVATLFQAYLLAVAGVIFTLVVAFYWLWPKDAELEAMRQSKLGETTGLPLQPTGTASTGIWAMLGALLVLTTVFGILYYSYFYLWLYSSEWPQGGFAKPELLGPALIYGILIVSGLLLYTANRTHKKAQSAWTAGLLAGCVVLGAVFIALLISSLTALPFNPKTNAYGSIFHVLSWHVAALVFGGILFALAAAIRNLLYPNRVREGYVVAQMQITSLYWYFTIAVGVLSYLVLYVSPWLISATPLSGVGGSG